MRRSAFKPLLLAGIIGTSISGPLFVEQYRAAVWGRKDIWWTPMELALPLSATASQFELYVGGELLQRRLEHSSLLVRDPSGTMRPATSAEIRVRLNNWQRIRGDRLHGAVFSALSLGASLTCLGIGLAQLLRSRKKIGAHHEESRHHPLSAN